MPLFDLFKNKSTAPPDTKALITTWHAQLIVSESTRRAALATINSIFELHDLGNLTPTGIEAIRDELRRHGSPSTQQKRLAAARNFLTWCIIEGHAPAAITLTLIEETLRPVVAPHRPPVTSVDLCTDVQRLTSTITDPRTRALVLLALSSGWSPHEIVQLNRRDLDTTNHMIRQQPFPASVIEALHTICTWQPSDTPVFTSRRRQRLSEAQARRILESVRRQAHIPVPLTHWIRQQHKQSSTRGIPLF